MERLLELARREHITLACVHGLGAADQVTVGVYFPATKEYKSNSFEGEYEIISLHGTLTTQQGQPYGHFHMSIGDEEGRVFGGHLNRAVISATCELVITLLDGGQTGVVSRIIYTLVGLAGLWCVSLLFRRQNHVGIAD